MSKVSDVYDALDALVAATLTGYMKIPNPYVVDQNNNLILDKGYGITFNDAVNPQDFSTCKVAIERTFGVILFNRVTTTDHNLAQRATLEKALLEDQFLLLKAVEADPDLDGSAANARYESDTGILMEGDKLRYMFLETVFSIKYIENLL